MSKKIDTAIETARDLKLDKVTLRDIEALGLPEIIELSPQQIKRMRTKAQVSQHVMAKYLNVSPSIYQKWERGEITPSGGNMKLLNLVYRKGLDAIA